MASLPSVDGWRCGRKLVMNLLLLSNWLFDIVFEVSIIKTTSTIMGHSEKKDQAIYFWFQSSDTTIR